VTAYDRLRKCVLARMWHDPGGVPALSDAPPSDPAHYGTS
jgi:hypothetical protein